MTTVQLGRCEPPGQLWSVRARPWSTEDHGLEEGGAAAAHPHFPLLWGPRTLFAPCPRGQSTWIVELAHLPSPWQAAVEPHGVPGRVPVLGAGVLSSTLASWHPELGPRALRSVPYALVTWRTMHVLFARVQGPRACPARGLEFTAVFFLFLNRGRVGSVGRRKCHPERGAWQELTGQPDRERGTRPFGSVSQTGPPLLCLPRGWDKAERACTGLSGAAFPPPLVGGPRLRPVPAVTLEHCFPAQEVVERRADPGGWTRTCRPGLLLLLGCP